VLEMEHSDGTVGILREYLYDKIPIIYDNLKQGISERENIEEMISKRISKEFGLIQERLAEEKNLREA